MSIFNGFILVSGFTFAMMIFYHLKEINFSDIFAKVINSKVGMYILFGLIGYLCFHPSTEIGFTALTIGLILWMQD